MQLRYSICTLILFQLFQLLHASAIPSSRHEILPSSLLSEHKSYVHGHEHDPSPAPHLIRRNDWRHLRRNFWVRTVQLAGGWIGIFNLLDMVQQNVAMAAQQLEEFYADILGEAGDVWASQPAQNLRVASFGDIKLILRSNQPIPWEWIQAFVTDMIHNIRAGDAAIVSYKITFLSAVTGAIIVAQLQLPNAGAAAAA